MKKLMMLSLMATALIVIGCSSRKDESRVAPQDIAPIDTAAGPSASVASTAFGARLAILSDYSQADDIDGQTYLDRVGAFFLEVRSGDADVFTAEDRRALSHAVGRLIPLNAAGVEFPAEGLMRYASSSWDQDTAIFVGLAIKAQGYRKGALLLDSSWPEALDNATAWRQWADERGATPGDEGLQYRQIAMVFAALAWIEEAEGSERKLMACAGAHVPVCEETLGGGTQ